MCAGTWPWGQHSVGWRGTSVTQLRGTIAQSELWLQVWAGVTALITVLCHPCCRRGRAWGAAVCSPFSTLEMGAGGSLETKWAKMHFSESCAKREGGHAADSAPGYCWIPWVLLVLRCHEQNSPSKPLTQPALLQNNTFQPGSHPENL